MRGLRTATAFLTRVPVGARLEEPAALARAVPWFPVVGGALGVALALLYAGLLQLVPPVAAAAVTIVAGIAVTGAFHEDGLADMADALGAWTDDDAVRILKDPTHGTYGVTAIVSSVVIRIAALSALDPWTALAALPAAHAVSRAAAAGLLAGPPGAQAPEGLAVSYLRGTGRRHVAGAVLVGLAIGTAALGPLVTGAAVIAAVAALAVRRLAMRRIGAVTGDVLGAAQQAAEILVLLGCVAAAGLGWLTIPWAATLVP